MDQNSVQVQRPQGQGSCDSQLEAGSGRTQWRGCRWESWGPGAREPVFLMSRAGGEHVLDFEGGRFVFFVLPVSGHLNGTPSL